MTQDTTDEIRATVLAKLHREGFYKPKGVAVDTAASFGIPTHQRGQAKDEIREMAESSAYPVTYMVPKDAVYLKQETDGWVAAMIRRHDGDLPWDLEGL